ncbi:homeodomain-interacting protein kinase 3-like [Morone saxatilis]|uniref:homeodomain-interacting protein kinase 3-like n=1 Tax=Morone saxatilis TaxID=34816 RepID=UPI0015E20B43|nr:homeodomain-interacting protein kinase 3-like [Morone saxatilis]
MTENQYFQVVKRGLISSASSDYEVQELLGSGTFGEVTQCWKLATNEIVAVKIMKSLAFIQEAKEEEEILKMMKELNSEKFNIVRWNDSFTFQGRFCLEFEKLDISLFDFLKRSQSQSLQLAEIRPIIQQLATALNFLKSAGIVHADLKPDNIMMVDHLRQPLTVKVIDFGLACNNPEAWTGSTLQTLWYRALEILLGRPFNNAIDVWSLGCIAAEMLMGIVLFPGCDEYDMSPCEAGKFFCHKRTVSSLYGILYRMPHQLSRKDASADGACFVDLLSQMLKMDASERITPSQILQHPFVTMCHLVDNSSYAKKSKELMSNCESGTFDDGEDGVCSTSKTIGVTSISTANLAHHRGPEEGHPAGLSGREQPFLQSSIIREKKRKRDAIDESECDNRSPDTILAKKRKSECLDAARTEAGLEKSPLKSPLHKRQRDDADCTTSDGSSPAKKRRMVNLNEELADSTKKLLCNTEAWSGLTQVHHLRKRNRADEEASGSRQEQTSPVKRRRGRLDGGEG